MSKHAKMLRQMVVSSVLLSIALVLKLFFTLQIPLFGQNGMTVGVSGIFSMMPSLMFGPWYGAAVSGLSDLMGYLLKPTGAYMPLLTLSAALGGFLRGWAYQLLKKHNERCMRNIVLCLVILLLAMGLYSVLALGADGVNQAFYEVNLPEDLHTEDMHLISRLAISRTMTAKNPTKSLETFLIAVTYGPLGCAAAGLLLIGLDLLVRKLIVKEKRSVSVPAMLLCVMSSGLIVSTINTVILRETVYASWKLLPFIVLWLPRTIEEILAGAIKVCFIIPLMGIYAAQMRLVQLEENRP